MATKIFTSLTIFFWKIEIVLDARKPPKFLIPFFWGYTITEGEIIEI